MTGTTLPGKVGDHRFARRGEILQCPWDGWEFDLINRASLGDPPQARVRVLEAVVRDERVVVRTAAGADGGV